MDRASLADRNLSEVAQGRHLRWGVLLFGITTAVGLALGRVGHNGAPFAARLALFVPFLMASYALSSGLCRTCGILAARGVRETTDGVEPVCDRLALSRLRKGGLRVVVTSFFVATAATLLLALHT